MKNKNFLELDYLQAVCTKFDESPIFRHFDKYKNKNFQNMFICITYRLRTSAEYINSHKDSPKNEDQTTLLLFHCIQIYNGIKLLFESLLDKKIERKNKKYFCDCFRSNNIKQNISDDVFFEYIRSLALAHPFDTDSRNRPFMSNGELHTSNWIDGSNNDLSRAFSHCMPKKCIKICYLSNKSDNFEIWEIPLQNLKKFIKSKWNLLQDVSNKMINDIIEQNKIWQLKKCDRTITDPIDAFNDIKSILNSRLIDSTYEIDRIISYYQVKLTIKSNQKSVNKFLNDISASITDVRNLVDNLEYEAMYELLDQYVHARPKLSIKCAHMN